jgi:hypothetical protein
MACVARGFGLIRRHNDIDSRIEIEYARVDDEVLTINVHGIPVVEPL